MHAEVLLSEKHACWGTAFRKTESDIMNFLSLNIFNFLSRVPIFRIFHEYNQLSPY